MSSNLTLITGASSDIGLALTRYLLETSDRTILAHSFRGSERVAELQAQYGDRVRPLQADLSDPYAAQSLADEVAAAGELSAFVHLPALPYANQRFSKFDWERFDRDFNIQVRSMAMLLQRCLPKMSKRPGSRVVFMLSSVVHGAPPKFTAAYTTAKYAQLGLFRALAAEYAGTQVRVNAISPSMVETRFLSEIPEVTVQMSAASNPLGRNATPSDLLGAFGLLLSEEAEYINGANIPITAGMTV